jgi:hypothetical protein
MYELFRRLEKGEFMRVSSFDVLEQAVRVAEGLNDLWPGEYLVRDSNGKDVGDPDSLNSGSVG